MVLIQLKDKLFPRGFKRRSWIMSDSINEERPY